MFGLATMLLCVGCQTFKVIVTVCDAEDAVMKTWATAHNDGKTSVEFDKSVQRAHTVFINTALASKTALQAYKDNGDKSQYVQALATTKAAALGVLDLVNSLVSQKRSGELKSMIAGAMSVGNLN